MVCSIYFYFIRLVISKLLKMTDLHDQQYRSYLKFGDDCSVQQKKTYVLCIRNVDTVTYYQKIEIGYYCWTSKIDNIMTWTSMLPQDIPKEKFILSVHEEGITTCYRRISSEKYSTWNYADKTNLFALSLPLDVPREIKCLLK